MTSEYLYLIGTFTNHSMGLAYRGLNLRYESFNVARTHLKQLSKQGSLRRTILPQVPSNHSAHEIIEKCGDRRAHGASATDGKYLGWVLLEPNSKLSDDAAWRKRTGSHSVSPKELATLSDYACFRIICYKCQRPCESRERHVAIVALELLLVGCVACQFQAEWK
jgi:hypothetical protein